MKGYRSSDLISSPVLVLVWVDSSTVLSRKENKFLTRFSSDIATVQLFLRYSLFFPGVSDRCASPVISPLFILGLSVQITLSSSSDISSHVCVCTVTHDLHAVQLLSVVLFVCVCLFVSLFVCLFVSPV